MTAGQTVNQASRHPFTASRQISRLRVPDSSELPKAVQDMLAGDPEESLRAMALDPEGLLKLFAYISHLTDPKVGSLSLPERDLIATVVAATNHCAIATLYHARKLGDLTGDHQLALIAAINPAVAGLSVRAQAIAKFAITLTRARGQVDISDFEPLRTCGLDDEDIFQVIALVGIFNCTTLMESALGLAPTVPLWP